MCGFGKNAQKATGAREAFSVSAYPEAPLEDFSFDHIDIEAKTAGTIANAKNWKMENMEIKTADGSKVKFVDKAVVDPNDVPYGEPR